MFEKRITVYTFLAFLYKEKNSLGKLSPIIFFFFINTTESVKKLWKKYTPKNVSFFIISKNSFCKITKPSYTISRQVSTKPFSPRIFLFNFTLLTNKKNKNTIPPTITIHTVNKNYAPRQKINRPYVISSYPNAYFVESSRTQRRPRRPPPASSVSEERWAWRRRRRACGAAWSDRRRGPAPSTSCAAAASGSCTRRPTSRRCCAPWCAPRNSCPAAARSACTTFVPVGNMYSWIIWMDYARVYNVRTRVQEDSCGALIRVVLYRVGGGEWMLISVGVKGFRWRLLSKGFGIVWVFVDRSG